MSLRANHLFISSIFSRSRRNGGGESITVAVGRELQVQTGVRGEAALIHVLFRSFATDSDLSELVIAGMLLTVVRTLAALSIIDLEHDETSN